MEHFDIASCNDEACINYIRGNCVLDKLPIIRWVWAGEALGGIRRFQLPTTTGNCAAQPQVNVFRTHKLIEGTTHG